MNDERFLELAMKTAAGQSTDAERAELYALLTKRPELKAEFEQLQAEARLARETLPLVAATEATAGEFPAYARGRLQTKVRQTYGRSESKETAEAKPNRLWLRWLAFAMVAAVIGLLAIPTLLQPSRPVIQVAMIDPAGASRGADASEVVALKSAWKESEVRVFTSTTDAEAWENTWSEAGKRPTARIIYDRAAAQVRVVGHRAGKTLERTFAVEKELAPVLIQAKAFIDEQFQTK